MDVQSELGRFGRYQIVEALARGGMAEVFLARRDGAPDLCVVKKLLGSLAEHKTAGKRFYREAHVASFLDHPNIAGVIDAGTEDDAFYLAMDFIAGMDIEAINQREVMDGNRIPLKLTIRIALDVLAGLGHAHALKDPTGQPVHLVHRDLSPRNVMIGFDGRVKIIDFGLARGDVDSFKTAPGMFLGTVRYVSPEQGMGIPVDYRSDIYSWSVVLWEMITGHRLVEGTVLLDMLYKVASVPAPPPSSLNPEIPAALDAVILKGLEKKCADRWQSAAEYAAALSEAAGPLAQTRTAVLGTYVTARFPEEKRAADDRLTRGRALFADLAPVPQLELQDAPDDPAHRTRTAYVRPSPLTGPDGGSPTRTGVVDGTPTDLHAPTTVSGPPNDLTRTGVHPGAGEAPFEATRTAVVAGPDDERTAVIRSDRTAIVGDRRDDRTAIVGGGPAGYGYQPPHPSQLPFQPPPSSGTGWKVAVALLSVACLAMAFALFYRPPAPAPITSQPPDQAEKTPPAFRAVAAPSAPVTAGAAAPAPRPEAEAAGKAPTRRPRPTRRSTPTPTPAAAPEPAAPVKAAATPITRIRGLLRTARDSGAHREIEVVRDAVVAASAKVDDARARGRIERLAENAFTSGSVEEMERAVAELAQALR